MVTVSVSPTDRAILSQGGWPVTQFIRYENYCHLVHGVFRNIPEAGVIFQIVLTLRVSTHAAAFACRAVLVQAVHSLVFHQRSRMMFSII